MGGPLFGDESERRQAVAYIRQHRSTASRGEIDAHLESQGLKSLTIKEAWIDADEPTRLRRIVNSIAGAVAWLTIRKWAGEEPPFWHSAREPDPADTPGPPDSVVGTDDERPERGRRAAP
jgi:hypothetical protein